MSRKEAKVPRKPSQIIAGMPRQVSDIIGDLIAKHIAMQGAPYKRAYTLSNDCIDLKAELDTALRAMVVKIVANRQERGR